MPPFPAAYGDKPTYDEIYSPEFFAALADDMGIALTHETARDLRNGHHEAFTAFHAAEARQSRHRSESAENDLFARIGKLSESLQIALVELFDFDAASAKLAQQVRENPTSFTGRDGGSLSALLNADRPDNPFFDLQQYLSDLSMSAARAQNRKPKAATPINAAISVDSTAEMLAALEAMTEENLKPQLVPAEELPRAVQDWKDRAAAHRLAPNLPLDCFIATFAPVWRRMSRFAYSEGKYLTEIGTTSSRAVDAIHRSVERLDPAITRQNVVTAFRSWRKEKQD